MIKVTTLLVSFTALIILTASSIAGVRQVSAGSSVHPKKEHFVEIVDTDNSNICDPNDKLVQKYRNNVIALKGDDLQGKVLGGAGLLIEGCTKLITMGHVLYNDDIKTLLNDITYGIGYETDVLLPRKTIAKEGNWKTTHLVKDEPSYINFAKHKAIRCAHITMIDEVTPTKIAEWSKRFGFYVLKQGVGNKLCAQKCAVSTVGGAGRLAGSVLHDCSTEQGNSGSPIFMKTRDLEIFVGMHFGAANKARMNVFAPVSLQDIEVLNQKPNTPLN